jgi:hypothetical protein
MASTSSNLSLKLCDLNRKHCAQLPPDCLLDNKTVLFRMFGAVLLNPLWCCFTFLSFSFETGRRYIIAPDSGSISLILS